MQHTTAADLIEALTKASTVPKGTVHLAFEGGSDWLRQCRLALEGVPGLSTSGTPDIVVTDGAGKDAWCFALNGRRLDPDLAGFFHHANQGPHPIELSLHSPQGEEARLLIPPVPGFYWRQQHAAAMEAAPLLLALAVLRLRGCPVRRSGEMAAPQLAPAPPTALELNWFKLKKAVRSLYLRLPGTSGIRRWQIALHPRAADAIPATGWQWFGGFPGHESADPFLISHQGRQWLFYEDMLPGSRHGRLAVAPAHEAGAVPAVILEKPYHLSYPCVFPHDGQWWMIPESSANGTVDLYRATDFPLSWEHVKTLLSGLALVDTTPLFHHGRWYFFTAALLPGRAYLSLLFTADTLDGAWRLHPSSPLTGDAAIARGAGPIGMWNGRLVRPVQDCLKSYGYAMTLNEIVELTPETFVERPLRQILPDWQGGLHGTHTFCPDGPALALDALR